MDLSDLHLATQFRLGFLIHDVSRLRRTFVEKVLKPVGITPSQWWVLTNLADLSEKGREQLMQTELARTMDIGKVALGGLLDRLETGGYIVRRADPADRRAKRIEMTPKGRGMIEGMRHQAAVLNRKMLVDLTDDEVHVCEQMLSKLKRRLMLLDEDIRGGVDVLAEDPAEKAA